MLSHHVKETRVVAELLAWDSEALAGGTLERGELALELPPEKIADACRWLKREQGFVRLSGITAVDRYPMEPRFQIVYLLHSVERNERLRLICRLDGARPEVDSVTGVWQAADWYEREVFDLFGIGFRDHPNLKRLMLPEGWDGHPLRKDYPVHGHKYSYRNEQ